MINVETPHPSSSGERPGAGRPVVFGEVLFDRFADGRSVLGGAPFNVAWHLRGFGLAPLFISRVGEDALGERVLATMARWGMDMAGMQRDPAHPTGQVTVALHAGQPSYTIRPHQAYDHIDAAAAVAAVAGIEPALLYHGTLASRGPISMAALDALRTCRPLPAFVDINLRMPWWNIERVARAIHGACWTKLNEQEVADLAGAPIVPGRLPKVAEALRREHRIDTFIVTLGAAGALILSDAGHWHAVPPPVDTIIDTVGAGDAFSAVAILGLLRGWPVPLLLERATAFAARLCGMRGATVEDPDFYREQLRGWDG